MLMSRASASSLAACSSPRHRVSATLSRIERSVFQIASTFDRVTSSVLPTLLSHATALALAASGVGAANVPKEAISFGDDFASAANAELPHSTATERASAGSRRFHNAICSLLVHEGQRDVRL